MKIFNKILHCYAMYYVISFQKKVMALCLRVQFFLANPVHNIYKHDHLKIAIATFFSKA